MMIGVLAIQGAFAEHITILKRLGIDTVEVRLPRDLAGIDGLIIPGGESTTFYNLLEHYKLIEPLQRLIASGLPVWGTCAGMILLAKEVTNTNRLMTLCLPVMNVRVERNAFGRQAESFETCINITGIEGGPFPAVFIRAPLIEKTWPPAEVLAKLSDGSVVAAHQGNILVISFHPELTADIRLHRYFIKMVKNHLDSKG